MNKEKQWLKWHKLYPLYYEELPSVLIFKKLIFNIKRRLQYRKQKRYNNKVSMKGSQKK